MAKTAILAIKIIGDAAGGLKALGKTEGMAGKLGGAMMVLGGAAAAVGSALLVYGASAVKAGGNLEQSIGAVDTVFKRSADQMHAWGKTAATDVGLARNEFNELSTILGTQLKNGGTAMDQLAPKTKGLITLGADLSSMFGGTTADAVGALSSALKGERDPIERYGVSLNQASIDAKAAELGFKKVGGALSAEANQAATLALIMEQTKDAHGNFAKESNTWNHQIEVLKAGFGSFTSELGLKLLPIFTAVVTFLVGQLLPGFQQVIAGVDPFLAMLGSLGASFITATDQASPLGGVLGDLAAWATTQLVPALMGLGGVVMEVFTVAAGIITEFVTNAISIITPMMPTIMEIFGAIGDIITGVITLIGAVIRTGLGAVQAFWNTWGGSIMSLTGVVFGAILGVIRPALDTIKAIISVALSLIKGDWQGAWNGMADVGRGFLNTIGAIFAGAGNILLGAGRAIIDGFLRGLRGAWDAGKGFISGIGDWIARNKGPLDYDRRLLRPAGQAIMGGLVSSLEGGMPKLAGLITDVTQMIGGLDANPRIHLQATGSASGTSSATAPAPVQITINGALDPRAVADQLRKILNSNARVRGAVALNGLALA